MFCTEDPAGITRAAGEDRYCIRIQPPLACDAVERCRWASSFIKASGIEVIKHFYTVDSYDAAFKLSMPEFGGVVRVSSGSLCYVHAGFPLLCPC
ncbi:hypothetical protein Tco_1324464 [Tanacetum coccineum]